MSDFKLDVYTGDVELNGTYITHMEHADDVFTPSTSDFAFQRHLNDAQTWFNRSGCETSIPKCNFQVLGKQPKVIPDFHLDGKGIAETEKARYLGVWLNSKDKFIWKEQYSVQKKNATRTSNVILALDRFLSDMPAWDLRTLYIAMVDPYLIAGCEIILDVNATCLRMLQKVQHYFLRRMLGIGSRSMRAVLFSETGIWPIQYRRVYLALKNLRHLMGLEGQDRPAYHALLDSLTLARNGHDSWAKDLCTVLSKLHVPVVLDVSQDLTQDAVEIAMKAVRSSMESWIDEEITGSEKVKDLLANRLEWDSSDRKLRYQTLTFRHYLRVKTAAHRIALTRMILSCHSLAIERRRWKERRKDKVPREWRLCRFCRSEVEDPAHALFICDNHDLMLLRETFLGKFYAELPEMRRSFNSPVTFFCSGPGKARDNSVARKAGV
ncbi:hypothetical protein C8F01DRAFT_987168 [Mycena amicta]|nr:hypothetical protein C8F01DRAFT_987168 [Mycena amicta]